MQSSQCLLFGSERCKNGVAAMASPGPNTLPLHVAHGSTSLAATVLGLVRPWIATLRLRKGARGALALLFVERHVTTSRTEQMVALVFLTKARCSLRHMGRVLVENFYENFSTGRDTRFCWKWASGAFCWSDAAGRVSLRAFS